MIYNVFHVSLLKQDTTKKGQVDNNATELDVSNNSGEYKIEAICDSAVQARESAGHLLELYYLVFWKDYLEKENTWEPYSTVQHFTKLISLFYKDHLDKSRTTSKAIDTAPLMAKPTINLIKQKQGRPTNSSNKRAKKN